MSDAVADHRMHRMYTEAELYQDDWRARNTLNFAYPDGSQWTEEETEIIEGRGQQATVLNISRPTVDMVVAQAAQRKTDIQIVGREMSDDETAGVLTELLKHVYDQNDYSYYEMQVFRTGVTGGMGWFQVYPKEDEAGTVQIKIDEVPWEEVYWDPYMRKPDGSDARYAIRQKWMDLDQAKRKWPEAAIDLGTQFDTISETFAGQEEKAQYKGGRSFDYTDHRARRVAIHEVYYKDDQDRLRHCIYSGLVFLKGSDRDEDNDPPYGDFNEIPFVPYIASRNKDGEPQGVIEWIRPVQDSLNKLYSKWQWNIMSRQIISDVNACDDWDEVREEIKRPDGLILTNPGYAGSLAIQKNIEESAHMANMMQFLVSIGQQTSGVNPAMLGQGGVNARSAEQEASRIMQGAAMQTSALENLMFTKKRVAKLVLKMMGEYYDDKRTVRITRPNGEYDYYLLNEPYEGPGGAEVFYQIEDVLRYDVVLKPVAAFSTARQNTMSTIAEAGKAGAMPPPVASKLIIELADIPDKQRVINEIDQYYQQQHELAMAQAQADAVKQAGSM